MGELLKSSARGGDRNKKYNIDITDIRQSLLEVKTSNQKIGFIWGIKEC